MDDDEWQEDEEDFNLADVNKGKVSAATSSLAATSPADQGEHVIRASRRLGERGGDTVCDTLKYFCSDNFHSRFQQANFPPRFQVPEIVPKFCYSTSRTLV